MEQNPAQNSELNPIKKITPRWVIVKLTGLLFTGYSAYNIFIIVRDYREMSPIAIIISSVVAIMFAVLAGFAFTSEVRDVIFRLIRKAVFVIDIIAIFALKARVSPQVVEYTDFSLPHTVMNCFAFFLTLIGMLVLFVYYAFFHGYRPLYPVLCVILPSLAIVLFAASLACEAVLFFGYGIILEDNLIRTVVIRPVFYMAFIGLSLYFLIPRRKSKRTVNNALPQ